MKTKKTLKKIEKEQVREKETKEQPLKHFQSNLQSEKVQWRRYARVQCNPNLAVGLLLDEAADSFQSSLPEQVGQGDPADPENTTVDESLAKSRQNKSKDIVCSQQKTTSKIRESHCAVEPEKESTFHPFHHGQVEPAQTESSLEVGYCTNPVILVLGHVDVGKSTFLGHILHLTGNIDERMLRKLKKESSDSGRSDLSYAWVLDDQEAERERGVTMDISIRQVHFKRLYTFLDTPGHYDFLSAVIAAASQAQVAILLVDASPGQFETCFHENGPTLEHAIIVRSMGVNKVIVAINKMDQVNYAEERFTEIRNQVIKVLTSQIGYSESHISCIPCSGLTGENILRRDHARLSHWYAGDTIMEAVDRFCKEPVDDIQDKHFRMPCMDVVEEKKDSETLRISGCIMSGKVKVGDIVRIHPSQMQQSWTVRSIVMGERQVSQAVVGDWSALVLIGSSSGTSLRVGHVLADPNAPLTQGRHIVVQLVVFGSGKKPILKGTPVMLHVHCFQGVGVLMEFISVSRKDESYRSYSNRTCHILYSFCDE
ncbi:HBS1-like protein [Galdieria sulphuraria]|nr:HBS1-like protein [Galdieria sulphuraria]